LPGLPRKVCEVAVRIAAPKFSQRFDSHLAIVASRAGLSADIPGQV
jgi:hypothetical protein